MFSAVFHNIHDLDSIFFFFLISESSSGYCLPFNIYIRNDIIDPGLLKCINVSCLPTGITIEGDRESELVRAVSSLH
jgi:hypothetical protein